MEMFAKVLALGLGITYTLINTGRFFNGQSVSFPNFAIQGGSIALFVYLMGWLG